MTLDDSSIEMVPRLLQVHAAGPGEDEMPSMAPAAPQGEKEDVARDRWDQGSAGVECRKIHMVILMEHFSLGGWNMGYNIGITSHLIFGCVSAWGISPRN